MNKYFVFIVLVLFIFSCKPSLTVKKINEAEFNNNNLVYYLPETVIKIDIEIEKTTYQKGPYFQFAEKFLGIKDVESEDYEKYKIKSIKLNTYGEPDYKNAYAINFSKKSNIQKIHLTKNGLISGININSNNSKENEYFANTYLKPEKTFPKLTDLTVKRNLNETEDTIYKKVKHDSITIKVPVIKKQMEKKTLNEKAEEAANFIIKIRKRRFKLNSGMTQIQTDGQAINRMIDELNELENNYLSLFIGQKQTEIKTHTFEYIPNSEQEINNGLLFYFSEKRGVQSSSFNGADIISIKILKCGKTNVIENYKAKKTEKTKPSYSLVYRIPDCGLINIQKNDEVLYTKKEQIAQFGSTFFLPNNLINRKGVKIEFDSNLGSISKIY